MQQFAMSYTTVDNGTVDLGTIQVWIPIMKGYQQTQPLQQNHHELQLLPTQQDVQQH